MILSNNNCEYIKANLEILDFIDYTVASIKINKNCCDETVYFKIDDIKETEITDKIYVDSEDNFIINSDLFGGSITDGIYTIEIKLYQNNGTFLGDTGCIFIDCETKCIVYEVLQDLTTEKEKTDLLMLHYSLSVGSNCSCNCEELCYIYKALLEKLGDKTYTGCGC